MSSSLIVGGRKIGREFKYDFESAPVNQSNKLFVLEAGVIAIAAIVFSKLLYLSYYR